MSEKAGQASRTMKQWKTVRGFMAGGFAFLICPCHLPVVLPILLGITAGTAAGGWLVRNTGNIQVASALLFFGGLLLMVKWLFGAAKKVQPENHVQAEERPAFNILPVWPIGRRAQSIARQSSCAKCRATRSGDERVTAPLERGVQA